MQNSIHTIIPRFKETMQMRVKGRRCCGNGSNRRGWGGGPNDFLAGGPEIWSYATAEHTSIPRRGSKDSEKKHVAQAMDLCQITVHEHFGLVNIWIKVHHVAWKSLVRIFSPSPKLSGLRRWILSQILNFHDQTFFGDTRPISGVRCQGLGNL